MKYAQDIILKPVITERSMDLIREQRKYTFKVAILCKGVLKDGY